MKTHAFIAAMVMAACMAAPAFARPVALRVTDCPLRDAPFSVALPLIDVLASPAAKAVVDRKVPGLIAHLPPMMVGATPPSFAAILDLHDLMTTAAAFTGARPIGTNEQVIAILASIDADLRRLPVTPADQLARCARYDNDRPVMSLPPGRPRLLLFEKISGFRDGPSVDAAHAALIDLAKSRHWSVVATDKGGAITPDVLRRFDAVIWNNISGDVLTLSQRAALRGYLEHGGGFVGLHGAAGDPRTWWDWYTDTLIGARFAGHPYPNQFQTARVVIDNRADPIAKGLPDAWTITDEWYSFVNNPRASGSHILATLDESTYDPAGPNGQNLRMGDHPIAWSRCIVPEHADPKQHGGRMFYSAIGHRPQVYADPVYRRMLVNAVEWAGGRNALRSCP